MTEDAIDPFSFLDREQTPEEATADFRQALTELGVSQRGLASRMKSMGDSRSFDTILRSVQRMATGEAKVAGEMQVIIEFLRRELARAKRMVARTQWTDAGDGWINAEIDDVVLSLSSQTRGRWQVHARHRSGYSPPIPHWRGSLDEAKIRAALCVDEAADHMEAIQREHSKAVV